METTHCKASEHQGKSNKVLELDWDAINSEIKEMSEKRLFSDEAIEIMKRAYPYMSASKVTKLINKHLGTNYDKKQVKSKVENLGLTKAK